MDSSFFLRFLQTDYIIMQFSFLASYFDYFRLTEYLQEKYREFLILFTEISQIHFVCFLNHLSQLQIWCLFPANCFNLYLLKIEHSLKLPQTVQLPKSED